MFIIGGLFFCSGAQAGIKPILDKSEVNENTNMPTNTASNTAAPTQFLAVKNEQYAYRRFGSGSQPPLLFLQHFTGTFDNWDPAVTDALAKRGEVILFESAGIGRSTGKCWTRWRVWRGTRLLSSVVWAWPPATFSNFLWVAWSHNEWRWIVRKWPPLSRPLPQEHHKHLKVYEHVGAHQPGV